MKEPGLGSYAGDAAVLPFGEIYDKKMNKTDGYLNGAGRRQRTTSL